MMAAIHTAKTCAHCGAPALHGRPNCWSCGEPLAVAAAPAAAAAPIPPPEEYLRPCPECGEVSAIYHAKCPRCGLALSAALPPRLSDVPFGSDAELLSDGTIRLRASKTTRGLRLAVAVIAVIAVAYLSYASFTVPQAHSGTSREAVRVLAVPLFFGLFLVALVWTVFGSEVWEVGADRLVIRRALFGKEWVRQYSGGTLQVEIRYGRYGRRIPSLVARAAEGRVTLAPDGVGAGSVRELGAFLSRVTGWPFRDDSSNWP